MTVLSSKLLPTELHQATELEEVPTVASDAVIKAKETVDTSGLHPSIPSTNSEYGQLRPLKKKVQRSNLVYHTEWRSYCQSVDTMVDNIEKANVSSLQVASQRMNQMDQLNLSLTSCSMKKCFDAAIDSSIERGGLIIGICETDSKPLLNQVYFHTVALKMQTARSTLFYSASQHVAKMVWNTDCLTNSPWLAGVKVGDFIHAISITRWR